MIGVNTTQRSARTDQDDKQINHITGKSKGDKVYRPTDRAPKTGEHGIQADQSAINDRRRA